VCGIAGFVDRRRDPGDAIALLGAMGARLARRGPDGEGVWHDPVYGVGLAHRRLAIIDLSENGRQPMASADGRWQITFNGEIYNYRSLRASLAASGHSFLGHSDTEVLVNGIAHWGIQAAVERAYGMFAFAAYDRKAGELWLARDRAGEKPLYYYLDDTGLLLFGSTLAALSAHPQFSPRVNHAAVGALVQRGYVPAPLCIYENTWKVRPGRLLCCAVTGARPSLSERTYWSLGDCAATQAPRAGEKAYLDALHDTLLAVVSEQIVADRPLGAFLSGGIDSSLITALMQAVSDRPVKTFTIGFRDQAFDEAQHARAIAAHLGTEHTEVYLEPDAGLEFIGRLPAVYDEPFADSSQLPTLLVAEVARRDVVVALSGDGGDESFAGYDRYQHALDAWGRLRPWPLGLRRAAGRCLRGVGRAHADAWLAPLLAAFGIRDARRSAVSALRFWGDHLATPDLSALYCRQTSSWYRNDEPVPGSRKYLSMEDLGVASPATASDNLRTLMQWDFASYLPDDILVKVDRASMYHSLEVRAPLLDPRALAAAWALPASLLTADGRGKYPLRRLLSRHVPTALFERPKQGFAVPLVAWLRGPLKGWADECLSAERLNAAGIFDVPLIRLRWRQHAEAIWDNSGTLWPILCFMAWWRVNGCPPIAPPVAVGHGPESGGTSSR